MMAAPKHVVLGVTGGIAAYKAVQLLRLLTQGGSSVRVVMTEAAERFVGPITFSALSGQAVMRSFISEEETWNNHVELAMWADLVVIAPATANTLSKLAHGQSDDVLQAVCLSARCPIVLAPAMDRDMWHHYATQTNIKRLNELGYTVLPVGVGALASGLEGEGRMLEPEEIMNRIAGLKTERTKAVATNVNVLITAGPTQESIDAVRFISNRSSGKMGVALADAFAARGARVTLILGPSAIRPAHPNVGVVDVTTAAEMHAAAVKAFRKCDILVAAAAVADFRPKSADKRKIKKEAQLETIELVPTPDILLELGCRKKNRLVVGFALETDNELVNARKKLKTKNLDLIVLNSMNDEGAGFGHDTNKVTLIWRKGKVVRFDLMTKVELANKLADAILSRHA